MTITLKIDNPDVEKQLQYLVKEKQEISIDTLRNFLNSFQKEKKFVFEKKDPSKYTQQIEHPVDDENLSDVRPYAHVEDSGQYIHDLRRKRNS